MLTAQKWLFCVGKFWYLVQIFDYIHKKFTKTLQFIHIQFIFVWYNVRGASS